MKGIQEGNTFFKFFFLNHLSIPRPWKNSNMRLDLVSLRNRDLRGAKSINRPEGPHS